MKLVCKKSDLITGINIVMKAVSSKTTMSILECILIDATEGVIKFTANDMELGIETKVEGEIIEAGSIAIDAKIFSEIVRKLPDNDVVIEVNDETKANITCENSKFNILVKSADDFSYLPEIEKKDKITLSQFALKELIRQTIFTVNDADKNKILTGELFEVMGNRLKVVALDKFRIAIRNMELKEDYGNFKVLVPGKSLNEISKILNGGVDDEVNIRNVIKEYAKFEGYEVEEAGNGMQAVEICKEKDFDIIIMDVMMPKLDGFSAIKEIRKTKNIPVLMLSARGEEYDKLFGFEIGIDDYVVKPFSPKEVMARVAAITSRVKNNSKAKKEDKYVFEGLEIDMLGRVVVVDGEKKELTPKEYDLLVYLIKNKNIALSREKILNEVWGYDFFGEDRTVDTHVKMLRNSIGKYRDKITTIRGMGYKFEE
jgi:DNA-binding response OmpR family regulator